MFKTTLLTSALLAVARATTEISSSCISSETHRYGVETENDLPFTDMNYLVNSEVFNTIYRMTRLTLCEDSDGSLVGLRSHIKRYDAETMEIVGEISMNKIGTNQDVGITCNSIVLDAPNGEYLTGMYFAWENPGKIDYIRATSNKNQQISKGSLTSSMHTGEMTALHTNRILAFHGFQSDVISSVGQVSVDLDCIKGVTTVESIEEPIFVDADGWVGQEGHHTSTTEAGQQNWIYILIGVVIGVLLMVTATVVAVMYKQRKGCFKNVAAKIDGKMPIVKTSGNQVSNDIEFAGQTADQKRKSIKQMSKIVEVDEDLEDSKKPNKNKVNMIVSEANQLQSIASINQVTDVDEK